MERKRDRAGESDQRAARKAEEQPVERSAETRSGSTAWDTLLKGIFEYLHGPVRLEDLVSICGVLFGVKGSREMAFEEMMTDDEGRASDPPAPAPRPDVALAIREQLVRLWSEIKGMPKRVLPFLLNPPGMKGGTARRARSTPGDEPEKADRGEVAVFTANGITTITEMGAVIGFTPNTRSSGANWTSKPREDRPLKTG